MKLVVTRKSDSTSCDCDARFVQRLWQCITMMMEFKAMDQKTQFLLEKGYD